MNRVGITLLLALVATQSLADTWSIGYAGLPLKDEYIAKDYSTSTPTSNQKSSAHWMNVLQVMYSRNLMAVDSWLLTASTGLGIPMGSATYEATKAAFNTSASTSKNETNEGDSAKYVTGYMSLLVGGKYLMPLGAGKLSLGVSAGPMVSITQITTRYKYWQGTPPNEIEVGTTTYTRQVFLLHYAAIGAIGYGD